MSGNDLLSETRAFNAQVEQILAGFPSVHTVPPEVTRKNREEGRGWMPAPVVVEEGTTRSIPGPSGHIPLRVFVPEAVDGVYFHIHGGGWTLGSAFQQDVALWALAQQAGVAVVSVDYRLAPEDPYPAGADDCEAAASWLVANARAEFGTERLVIGGESAGAHLSALTLLRLRERGTVEKFCGANLVYGCYDLSMTPSQRRWGERNLVLSTPIIGWFVDCFLPGKSAEDRRDPDVSPLYADLSGMPPALFTVGTMDPLIDDTLFMEARWRAAGNAAELDVYEEGMHGFTLFPIAIAKQSIDVQVAFLRKATAS